MTASAAPTYDQQVEEFANRIVGSVIGAFDLHSFYLGQQLGFYRALSESGAMTSSDLAAATGTDERYAREWLEHQAVGGIIEATESPDARARRYALPDAHAEVLLERDSLNFVAGIVQLAIGALSQLQRVVVAYRSGEGIPFGDYGHDLRAGQGEINRPPFLRLLAQEWIPAMPDVHARLAAGGRVADLGCGVGWSAIGIAQAYASARVDGFDLDEASVAAAQKNVRGTGVEDRVAFAVRDAGDPKLAGQYDLVTILEALHDMSNPVQALWTAKRLLAEGGSVLVVDERVADEFTAPGDEIERLMYGWSILHCLPAGMADKPSAATGTVLRAPTVRRYAQEAGFSAVEELQIENLFFRFYRLRP